MPSLSELRVLKDIRHFEGEVEKDPFLQLSKEDMSRGKLLKGDGKSQDVIVHSLRISCNGAQSDRNEEVMQRIIQLAETWKKITHTGILTTHSINFNGPGLALVHPSCFCKDIITYIEDTSDMSPGVILTFAREIVAALAHLHERHVYVGTLYGRKIMYNLDNGHAVIADLGIEFILCSTSEYWQITPNCRWQAPELLIMNDDAATPVPTAASDVYSAGMTIFELYEGRRPFNHIKYDTQFIWKMGQGTLERLTKPNSMAPAVWSAIEDCFDPHPNFRPTAAELLRRLERLS